MSFLRYGKRAFIKDEKRRNTKGEMPEWSNGAVSKTVVPLEVPRVRIPLSPPIIASMFAPIFLFSISVTP